VFVKKSYLSSWVFTAMQFSAMNFLKAVYGATCE